MELFSISSSSKGNCILLDNKETTLMIDVGISRKRVVQGFEHFGKNPEDLDGILITHEHSDHIKGLGVFLRKYHIPVYATEDTIDYILNKSSIGEVDKELFFPIEKNKSFYIKNTKISPLQISHDAVDPVCYRFDNDSVDNSSGAIVTDLGTYDGKLVNGLQELDSILVESNHDVRMLQMGPYPFRLKQRIWGTKGHLSNEACGDFLNKIINKRMKHIILGHLSGENNYPELAFQAVKNELNFAKAVEDVNQIDLKVASRYEPSCNIKF